MSSNENVYKCKVCGEWHNDKLECVDVITTEPGTMPGQEVRTRDETPDTGNVLTIEMIDVLVKGVKAHGNPIIPNWDMIPVRIVDPGVMDEINKRLDIIEASQRCIISAILQQTAAKFSDEDCAITKRIITGDKT